MNNVLNVAGRLSEVLADMRRNLPLEVQRDWELQERKERELCESLRANCYDALSEIADAMRHPRISLSSIESAIAMLNVALDCAKALDK